MSLVNIVEKLGGDLFAGGREALIPAPGHSRGDRSVSLKLTNGRVVVHSFGGARWQEVLDSLRAGGLIDAHNAPLSISGDLSGYHAPAPTHAEKTVVAKALWIRARPVVGTLSAVHLRIRKIAGDPPGPSVLRHAEAAPLSAYKPTTRTMPALLAAITDAQEVLTAIEMTYLAADGRRTERLKAARKTVGAVPPNTSVKIDPAAPEMLVGEGYFTTHSARNHFQLPAHALLSIRNMGTWEPPEGVRSVLIAGDNGRWGRKAAFALQDRLLARGLKARAKFPEQIFDDWNAFAPELSG